MLATTQLQDAVDGELAPTASIPSVLEMPTPIMDTKCWHHSSDQGATAPRQEEEETVELNYTQRASSPKIERGKAAENTLKEPHSEAFSKESEVMRTARQAYYETHQPNFE